MTIQEAEKLLATLVEPAELTQFILSDADEGLRSDAVNKLFATVPPRDFLAISDKLAAEPQSAAPRVRWRVEFFKRQARGEDVDAQIAASAMKTIRSYRAQPDSTEWAAVRAYEADRDARSLEALLRDYEEHGGDGPIDRAIRFLAHNGIVRRVGRDAPAETRAMLRERFLERLSRESDFGLRALHAISLRMYCEPGDLVTAHRLETLAAGEENIYHVRPLIELLASQLRGR